MTREALLGHAWAQAALAVVLAVAVNHLAAAVPLRLDVTDDQRHSLSPVAADAVRGLETPLTATVWFTEDLGPPYHQHRQALLDLLAELEVASRGQLEVVVRDPTGDTEGVAAATAAGVRPVTWAYRDWDQTQARQVWMGLTLDHGPGHAAVDALPAIERMEHDVVRAILAVTTPADDRKTIGWLQGDGEPGLNGHPADHPLGKRWHGACKPRPAEVAVFDNVVFAGGFALGAVPFVVLAALFASWVLGVPRPSARPSSPRPRCTC